jgi:hypothetical protein
MASMTTLGFDEKKTQSAMRGSNPDNFNVIIDGHSMRPPLRHIYVFTVSKKTRQVKKKLFPGLNLRGCEAGERYVLCTPIPDPVPEVIKNEMTGGSDIKEHPGWRCVIDMLNPSNPTMDPYLGTGNPDFFSNRNGNNLIAEGFWPSLNETPTEEEIKRAEKHRDTRYRWMAKESQRLAARSKRDLDEFLQTYPDTHNALDALGIKTDWHSPMTVTVNCSNCGDEIKQGLAFHKSSVTDKLCVIDPERAYKAKAISKKELEELVGPI